MVLNYIAQFSVNYPLLFLLIIIIASLVILLKAADFLVLGITNYAERLGISDYLIGLIVISLGASLPELVSFPKNPESVNSPPRTAPPAGMAQRGHESGPLNHASGRRRHNAGGGPPNS